MGRAGIAAVVEIGLAAGLTRGKGRTPLELACAKDGVPRREA
jgi:hypothetical protein